jgi:hypothetical protein
MTDDEQVNFSMMNWKSARLPLPIPAPAGSLIQERLTANVRCFASEMKGSA